jgi:hypothetical protein
MARVGLAVGAGGLGAVLLLFLLDGAGALCGISPACTPAHTIATFLVVLLAMASPAAGEYGLAVSVDARRAVRPAGSRLIAASGIATNAVLVGGAIAGMLGWL